MHAHVRMLVLYTSYVLYMYVSCECTHARASTHTGTTLYLEWRSCCSRKASLAVVAALDTPWEYAYRCSGLRIGNPEGDMRGMPYAPYGAGCTRSASTPLLSAPDDWRGWTSWPAQYLQPPSASSECRALPPCCSPARAWRARPRTSSPSDTCAARTVSKPAM